MLIKMVKYWGGTSWNWDDGVMSPAQKCGSAATSEDNLAALCRCYYTRTTEDECKKLCGCTS
jgi:hypothetical protein